MESGHERRFIYMDNAATSFPKPDAVTDAVLFYMKEVGCNVNRGGYASAYSAGNVLFETREAIRELFNGDDCRNVIFTANVTQSINMIVKGLLKPGDHVLVTAMEHNGVMRPVVQLGEIGVEFDRIPCNPLGELDMDSVKPLCRPNTKAIISTHASNVCGTLIPIEELGKFCAENGLYFIVDSAQTAGLFPIDMEKMHIDALAFTGHKSLLAPQGTGGFLLKEHMVSKIEPIISGGTGSISHTEDIPSFMPDRFEPGTPNLPGIYGLSAALSYLTPEKRKEVLAHELELTAMLLDGLSDIKKVKVIGRKDIRNRAAVVSIQLEGEDSANVAGRLDEEYSIQARVGLHCAPNAHKTLGTYPQGTIRLSPGHATTREEILLSLKALEEISYGI